MIPNIEQFVQPIPAKTTWQVALKNMIRDPQVLFAQLGLDPTLLPDAYKVCEQFPLRVTQSFAARMRYGDIDDPLLRQVLPLGIELEPAADFVDDPLQEMAVNPVPGLLHKFKGRVLVLFSSACAIHCRYCFRRHFPYEDNNTPSRKHWPEILEYIRTHDEIHEVILSGGDPLTATDDYLAAFIHALALIPHVTLLRIHTRLPIVLPERITSTLLDNIVATRLQPVVVVHCNHPQEINEEVKTALGLLHAKGITLLNHTVLLRGVNDHAETLIALSRRLFASHVLPYYLNMLDQVNGAQHFAVSDVTALALHQTLTANLPGYLVPKLAREVPGAVAKMPV